MPVHSESRQPRTSSSSAIWSSACSCTRLLQLLLERVAVHSVVVAAELVDEVLDLEDGPARDDPERGRLAAAAVLLVRVRARELLLRRDHGAGVLERLALPFLPEHFPDHAASPSTVFRTPPVSSRFSLRKPSRSAVFGPWPVTTLRSSSQSGSLYSHSPSSFLRSSGSGTVSPSSQICGT